MIWNWNHRIIAPGVRLLPRAQESCTNAQCYTKKNLNRIVCRLVYKWNYPFWKCKMAQEQNLVCGIFSFLTAKLQCKQKSNEWNSWCLHLIRPKYKIPCPEDDEDQSSIAVCRVKRWWSGNRIGPNSVCHSSFKYLNWIKNFEFCLFFSPWQHNRW